MTGSIIRVDKTSEEFVREQWNKIAMARDEQLRSGRDKSFQFILKPTILRLISGEDKSNVLDVGCGSGVLTELVADMSGEITAIDMAERNIELALNSSLKRGNTRYVSASIEGHSISTEAEYSLIYANMVLQDVPCLETAARAIAHLSKRKTVFVATVTHPWFWPFYWNYYSESWFKYSEEFAVEAPYKISGESDAIGTTTHFHRPVSRYLSAFREQGFELVALEEPMPGEDAIREYKAAWKYPRFLAMKFEFLGGTGGGA